MPSATLHRNRALRECPPRDPQGGSYSMVAPRVPSSLVEGVAWHEGPAGEQAGAPPRSWHHGAHWQCQGRTRRWAPGAAIADQEGPMCAHSFLARCWRRHPGQDASGPAPGGWGGLSQDPFPWGPQKLAKGGARSETSRSDREVAREAQA